MKLYEVFDITSCEKAAVCLVGGGGKTSTLFALAEELKALDKNVLVTTTTAICNPEAEVYDELIVGSWQKNKEGVTAGITVWGREISKENKLLGMDKSKIDWVYDQNIFSTILIEGDGSKGRPIKAPAEYEPVIPDCTTHVVGVIGMDALKKPIDAEFVHRPEWFCQVTGKELSEPIEEETVCKLIIDEGGLFKGAPEGIKKYVLLNKADDQDQRDVAQRIVKLVLETGYPLAGIIIASIGLGQIYRKWGGHR
ncbi:MAG: selenium cofactor biosynthesis protein YqeC [Bacillota bacterium]